MTGVVHKGPMKSAPLAAGRKPKRSLSVDEPCNISRADSSTDALNPHIPFPQPCNTLTTMLQQRSSRLLSSLSHCAFRSTAAPLSASLRCRTQRPYSIHADASVGNKIQDIDPTKLSITRTTSPKDLLPPEDLIFGRNFTGRDRGGVITSQMANHRCRSHALARMDSVGRMAASTYHTVPKPESRPCHMCVPLRVRVLRGHEGVQGQERQHQTVQAGQEHGSPERFLCTHCTA